MTHWKVERSIRINDAWRRLVKVVFEKRELLLYAQRHSLRKWFLDYDPSHPDQLEDFNRPWDYDHIFPSYYVAWKQGIPPIIKDVAGKIGNLRAWPMELNRSDQALPPCKKLYQPNDDETSYGMADGVTLRRDSFIIDEENWLKWKAVSPNEDQPPPGYLSLKNEEHKGCREALVETIMARSVSIYGHWFKSLGIETLFRRVDVGQRQRS